MPSSEFYKDLVYHSNYWDGPLSGMMMYNEEQVWFTCVEDIDSDPNPEPPDPIGKHGVNYRKFAIIRLPEEIREMLKERHADFEKYVGMHTTYIDGKRAGQCHEQARWSNFYDKWKGKLIDLDGGEVIDHVIARGWYAEWDDDNA